MCILIFFFFFYTSSSSIAWGASALPLPARGERLSLHICIILCVSQCLCECALYMCTPVFLCVSICVCVCQSRSVSAAKSCQATLRLCVSLSCSAGPDWPFHWVERGNAVQCVLKTNFPNSASTY